MKLYVNVKLKSGRSLLARIRSWFKKSKITEMEKRLIELDIPFVATEDYIRIFEFYYDTNDTKYTITHYYNVRTDLWVFQVDQDNDIFGSGFHEFLNTYINYKDKQGGDDYDKCTK